jgi:hypothetical protein
LLKAAQGGSSNPLGMDIFAECVGSQMLMMSAFDPLLKASGMATEQNQGDLRSGPEDEANPGARTPRKAGESTRRRSPTSNRMTFPG